MAQGDQPSFRAPAKTFSRLFFRAASFRVTRAF
jgi:hypothetical protein